MARFSLTLLLILLVGGCSAAPRKELQAARMALARAQFAGAAELAPEEFSRANEALMEGEKLIRQRDYDGAKKILPRAEDLALAAQARARHAQAEQARALAGKPKPKPKQRTSAPKPVKPPPPPPPPVKAKPVAEPPPPSPPLTSFTVGEDQTLWAIAGRKDIYDDPLLWPLLYQANRDQIKDPRQIYPGQVLNIPRDLTPEELEEAREKARKSGIFPPGPQPKGDSANN